MTFCCLIGQLNNYESSLGHVELVGDIWWAFGGSSGLRIWTVCFHTLHLVCIILMHQSKNTQLAIFADWQKPSFYVLLLRVLARRPSLSEPLDVRLAVVRPVKSGVIKDSDSKNWGTYTETPHDCFIQFSLSAGSCYRVSNFLRVLQNKF